MICVNNNQRPSFQNAIEIGKASRSLKRAGERLAPSFKRFSDTSSRIADWSKLLDKLPPLKNIADAAPDGHDDA